VRVRSEVGSPPMLAPFARSIAEQALLHLQGTPRYAEIRPGVRRAVQQAHGATPGTVDAALARRLGALPRASRPAAQAKDAALVTSQVCGVAPEALPARAEAAALRYVRTTPADALVAGLTARAARYARLGVSGPDVAIEITGSEG
jgi:oxaloacetate decarboxylase alpha subunit